MLDWDRIPILERVVVRSSCDVEEPVALVAHEGFDLVDVFAVALDADADDVSMAREVNSRQPLKERTRTYGCDVSVTTISVNAVHSTSSSTLRYCVMFSALDSMPLETLAGWNCSL
jgi:hypothetical protein